jgi:Isochorismatase family
LVPRYEKVPLMTSAPVRDPLADHLITPENAAFLFIDYQPSQLAAVRSMDHELMVKNALDALREGYEVYPVVDAIGGTSPEAHRAGLDRVIQAGGQPISWVSLACELQRDWARQETVQAVVEIVLTDRLTKE